MKRCRYKATLRAIGYPSRLVQSGLIREASVVAALGVGIGVLLGLVVARNNVDGFAPRNPEILLLIPWRQIVLLSNGAWATVLLTTVAPA